MKNTSTVHGSIEEFLGPEISGHPIATNSKVTPEKSIDLHFELHVGELDKANMRSAPGIDGLYYRFMTEFWHIFCAPKNYVCSRHGFLHQRMNANGSDTK